MAVKGVLQGYGGVLPVSSSVGLSRVVLVGVLALPETDGSVVGCCDYQCFV